jgi:hypothetical protein
MNKGGGKPSSFFVVFFAIPRENCKNIDRLCMGGILVEKMAWVPFYSSGVGGGSFGM